MSWVFFLSFLLTCFALVVFRLKALLHEFFFTCICQTQGAHMHSNHLIHWYTTHTHTSETTNISGVCRAVLLCFKMVSHRFPAIFFLSCKILK